MNIVKTEEELKEHVEQIEFFKPEGELKTQSIEIMGVRGHVQILNEHVDNNIMKEVQLNIMKSVAIGLKNACSKMFGTLKKMIQEELSCRPSLAISCRVSTYNDAPIWQSLDGLLLTLRCLWAS